MKVKRISVFTLLQSVFLIVGVAMVAPPALAADTDKAPDAAARKDLVFKGDAKCTSCHDGSDNPQMLAIGKTKHGTTADGRTPTCTSCHGESDTHINKPEGVTERPRPERTFAKNSTTPVDVRNDACLSCHKSGKRMLWPGSTHQARDVACTSCHQVHTQHDNVRVKVTQPEVCFTCHKEQRAMISRPSHHPVIEGKVACSDCHNPHGSAGPKLLVRDSVNATCYTCHMEKRGPFLWEHMPVTDDCTNCHNPHGSTVDNMLKARMPFLCQQCHEPTSHRGNIPGFSNANQYDNQPQSRGITQGRACTNCHLNIHGGSSPTNNAAARSFRR